MNEMEQCWIPSSTFKVCDGRLLMINRFASLPFQNQKEASKPACILRVFVRYFSVRVESTGRNELIAVSIASDDDHGSGASSGIEVLSLKKLAVALQ